MVDSLYTDEKLYVMLRNKKAMVAEVEKGEKNKFSSFKTVLVTGLEKE